MLLFLRGGDSHHALGKTTYLLALSVETFAPKHAGTDLPFGPGVLSEQLGSTESYAHRSTLLFM